MTLKKFLLDTHIYSNLLCAGYLVIYGLSSVAFNHELSSPESQVEWRRAVDIPEVASDQLLADALRENLGLIGWVPKWEVRRLKNGDLSFQVSSPAKVYKIRINQKKRLADVVETRSGLWGVMKSLHGLSKVPGSTWSPSWGIYTVISILSLLYAVASGLLIWWMRSPPRHQLFLFIFASGATIIVITAIVW
jgi:hypothetical protein